MLAGASFTTQAATIDNVWSGAGGDKANLAAFAFRADAGTFPDSVMPAGSLTSVFQIDALTLIRPNDTTTPSIGAGAYQITSADAPVYVDVYSGYDSGTFSGYLGSSSGVTWSSTIADQPYTFAFSGVQLQSDQKYWFVFSEDASDGEVSNFRMKVNTSGNDATAGPGRGYMVGDLAQVIKQNGAADDWGMAYTVSFTAIPEPTTIALLAIGAALLISRKRI